MIEDKDSSEFKSTAFYLNSKIPLEALITAARNCETDSEGYFSDENYLSELKKMNSEYIIYGNVYDFLMTLYSKYFSSLNTHKFKFVHKMLGRDILGIVKKWKSSLGYGFIYYDNNTDIYFNVKSCKNYADINNLKRGCIIACNLIENDYYDSTNPNLTNCRYKAKSDSLSILAFEPDYTEAIKKLRRLQHGEGRKTII